MISGLHTGMDSFPVGDDPEISWRAAEKPSGAK
jgi:hypothetical protein